MNNQWFEIFGVITGIIYIILEIKQKPVMWIVGFITSLTFVVVFFQSKIYAQMALNIYYTIISIYGFIRWKNIGTQQSSNDVKKITKYQIIIFSTIAVVLFLSTGYLLKNFTTDSTTPYFDAFVGTLGAIATWMLSKKILEQWLIWLIVNISSIFLFAYNELYWTAFLYLIYSILSIYGFAQWKRTLPEKTK